VKGTKGQISKVIAGSSAKSQIEAIASFIDENLKFCKQHVHIFSHTGDAVLPETIPDGEQVLSVKNHALYLARITYQVVLLDPPKNDSIEFLWPIQIELLKKHLIIRFVVLEKNIASYFDREIMLRGKSLSEEVVTSSVLTDGTLSASDLNKGIKALWAGDLIDAFRIKYKKPGSTNTQNMDEEQGLKKIDPKVYEELQKFPLYMSVFSALGALSDVGQFSADPSKGFIGFTKYSKDEGSGDELIRQILENN
jgi:hypothetical protein